MVIASRQSPSSRGTWLIPVGLILLALIPIVSGSLRLTQLGSGPELIPAQTRFTASPIPVIVHIVSATLFSVVGAFQFLPAPGQAGRSWHRMAGRVLVPAGFLVAFTGLWMATIYPHPVGDGSALVVLRVVFGSYMVVSLVFAVRALTQHEYVVHGAWMTRAYALGVAAGTQAIALIPGAILFGSRNETSRAVAMGGAWLINLAVAEFVIRRRSHRVAARRARLIRR
jgi:hypothetical protein